ncbi:hypothetical protein V6U90_07900 [Micromonospora sp. CPCC 206060]|uniref:hypothetical protein n=1 Tax=Micromonospora sp. CPCC 206060 TaxID=3122406 RepID=UPI002FEF65E6
MKIDNEVEPLVRATLDAAVNRDTPRFESALSVFISRDLTQRGVEIAVAVCAYVLFDIHEGKPSESEIDELARDIARQEQWMDVDSGEAADLLRALVHHQPLKNVLPEESVVVLPYLVAANLLATTASSEDGEWWFNYLDKVEAAIEAAG